MLTILNADDHSFESERNGIPIPDVDDTVIQLVGSLRVRYKVPLIFKGLKDKERRLSILISPILVDTNYESVGIKKKKKKLRLTMSGYQNTFLVT